MGQYIPNKRRQFHLLVGRFVGQRFDFFISFSYVGFFPCSSFVAVHQVPSHSTLCTLVTLSFIWNPKGATDLGRKWQKYEIIGINWKRGRLEGGWLEGGRLEGRERERWQWRKKVCCNHKQSNNFFDENPDNNVTTTWGLTMKRDSEFELKVIRNIRYSRCAVCNCKMFAIVFDGIALLENYKT